jgi:hypothetical protein
MIAPYTRNWSANELPDFAGRRYHVEVKGEVETSATNLVPKLTEHVPQGINARILLLDLTIEQDGAFGGQVVMLRKAEYTRPTSGNAYDEADILFDGAVIERIKVGHPKTLATQARKKKPGKKKPARKAAKKAPAKKKAAKKAKKKKAVKRKKRL